MTLRGKKFEINEATSVEEIKTEISKLNGGKEEKADIIFNGKKLKSKEILEDAGVPDGAKLNMVPRLKKKSSSSSSSSKSAAAAAAGGGATTTSSTESVDSVGQMVSDYMKQAGVDDKLGDLMKSMSGLGGGSGGGPPDMKESMKMMSDMMSSPLFKDFLKDPEKLEQARQMMLNNPMFSSMMKSVPGMEDVLNDKDAWREAMLMAVDLFQNMDMDEITQMMESMGSDPNAFPGMGGGMPGMGGMGGMGASNGLFDGLLGSTDDNKNSDEAAAAAALDELSEGDD